MKFETFEHDCNIIPESWTLCYGDGEGDGEGGDDDGGADDSGSDDGGQPGGKDGKFFTQEQIDQMVKDRLDKQRRKFERDNNTTIKKLKELEQRSKMTSEERDALSKEIEELEKRHLSQEEIKKREAAKAKQQYESQLTEAQEKAKQWEQRYQDMTINNEIQAAASSNGVLPNSVPFLVSFLKPSTKLVAETDDNGNQTGAFRTEVEFEDRGEDGKTFKADMTISEVVARMKEMPDLYGNLFDSNAKGGTGTQGGKSNSSGKNGFRPGMSTAEYLRLRRENPDALYQ